MATTKYWSFGGIQLSGTSSHQSKGQLCANFSLSLLQTILYANLGVTGSLPILLLALYNVVAAFFNWVNAMSLDRFGRIRIITVGIVSAACRGLLSPGSSSSANQACQVGCVINLSVYAALISQFANTTSRVGNAFAILCLFLFAVFYGGCLDASSYVYCSEIFPTSVRAHGVGFSISALFLSNIRMPLSTSSWCFLPTVPISNLT